MVQAAQHEQRALLARATVVVGSVLAAQGELEQAVQHFEQGLQLFHASGMSLERAYALQSYAIALLGAGPATSRRREAVRLLREAVQIFAASQAEPARYASVQFLTAVRGRHADTVLEPGS